MDVTRELVIGRDDADVAVNDPEVSRRHASIRPGAGGAYRKAELLDLGSTNGTFVDGVRITGPVLVAHGARIELGDTTILVETIAADDGATRLREQPQGS